MDKRTKEILEIVAYIFLGYLIAVGALRGLSYGLNTDYPAVSVLTKSMEHHNPESTYINWMENNNHTREEISEFPFPDGMRQGDLVFVYGTPFEKLKVGDVIVFQTRNSPPIIHRIVGRNETVLYTKGDNNRQMDQMLNMVALPITEEYYQGRAVVHVPLLGYVKVVLMRVTS